jgi:hypothetical protein
MSIETRENKCEMEWQKVTNPFLMLLKREGVHVHYFTLAHGASNKKGCCLIGRSLEARKRILTMLCGFSFLFYK